MNTNTAAPRAVNCTQCGAPLTLHGGRQVRTLNCGFCGAVLDAREEYAVVKKFNDVQRPVMPLSLGMQGKIKDVLFTIIGVIQYRDGEGYSWIEYQVFSPTHGYHWLVFSDGHFVFSRRVRETPVIGYVQKSTFSAKGMTFKVYESYTAYIDFVEGELTYVASVGDKISVTEGICPPFGFSREGSGIEEEFQFGEYLGSTEVYEAFGVEPPRRKPRGVHAIQPYVPQPWLISGSKMATFFAGGVFIIALAIVLFGSGKKQFDMRYHANQLAEGVTSPPFEVSGKDSVIRIDFESNQDNSWAWYDLTVIKDDAPVAGLAKQVSYYHGYEGGESWSEGSRSANAYFTLADPGQYRLAIEASGGRGENADGLIDQPLYVSVREDVVVSRYFFFLSAFFVLLALLRPLRRYTFESRRWQAVLEDDDE